MTRITTLLTHSSVLLLLIIGLARPAATQGLDALEVFPPAIEVAVGEPSRLPVIAVMRYDDGFTRDVTASITVTVGDPAVAEPWFVLYVEDDDELPYWYVRGRAPGTTELSVTAGGLTRNVPVTVTAQPAAEVPLEATAMAIGSNLTDVADSSAELVFTDVFMSARPWVSSTADGLWDGFGQPLELDERGWVRRLAPGQAADTIMLLELDGHYPKGSYTLTWEGTGTLAVEKGFSEALYPRVAHPPAGTIHVAEIVVGPTDDDGVRLRILATDPADPIRNIRLWMPESESGVHPGNAGSPPPHPFRRRFLEQMSRYRLLRFGNWLRAMDGTDNVSQGWADATPVDYATQNRSWGVSPVWAIRLLDRLNRGPDQDGWGARVDGWFNIPYLADDGYVRGLAELLATTVDFAAHPQIRIFVEWANEVWNPAFLHREYAADRGLELELDQGTGDRLVAAMAYQAYRSREIFAIFEDVFTRTHPVPGGTGRLRRVIAGATAMPYCNHLLMSEPGMAEVTDVIAIGMYFGGVAGADVNELPADSLPTVDQLLDLLDNPQSPDNVSRSDLGQRLRDAAHARALAVVWSKAAGHPIELVAYEGGQHLVGRDYATAPEVFRLFEAANNHPRMGEMYRRLLRAWRDLGGADFVHFLHREKWWQGGLFGALSWYGEDETTTPPRHKYLALIDGLADPLVFSDGFESGELSAWDGMP